VLQLPSVAVRVERGWRALSETGDFLSKLQNSSSERGRPAQPPHLVPRQPTTALGWTMRKLREVNGWTASDTAKAFKCSVSHISRVEHGTSKPSRALVQFYEETFEAEGMLLSLFEVAEHASEQDRQRFGGRRPRLVRAVEGDATAYVDETIPHGTLMTPGMLSVKEWRIRNVGAVRWRGRRLERQGPLTGPGLITSMRHVEVPDTEPDEVAEIQAVLRAPGYDCTSIAYFKMVDAEGFLCFPDEHQLGLDVLVRVVRNNAGVQ
jgi:transcriptional regulator with XRE-family HTH domain